ncbi:hypothetical protein Mgra_00009614, partial [Meloidogyne graminicola]
EVKIIFEKESGIKIGLGNGTNYIYLWLNDKSINYSFPNKSKYFSLRSFTYKINDIIGCGLVYPPPNMTNKLPYIFFTKNGKQIGKAILLEKDCDSIKPFVGLTCCSIEANFGDNFFIYDVDKLCVTKEFYKEEEFK